MPGSSSGELMTCFSIRPASVRVSRVLQEVDDRTRARVIETVRGAFDPCVRGDRGSFHRSVLDGQRASVNQANGRAAAAS